MTRKTFIARHPVLTYFVLAYAVAWGGILLLTAKGGLGPASSRPMQDVFLVFVAMLIGPSVVGVGLTAVLVGKTGLKELVARWLRWRMSPRWYSALLLTPVLLLALSGLLSIVSPLFLPGLFSSNDKGSVIVFGVMIGLLAGAFEEIGWTGFALPRLLERRGILATGLMLGALWGAWHLLADYWGNAGSFGSLYP